MNGIAHWSRGAIESARGQVDRVMIGSVEGRSITQDEIESNNWAILPPEEGNRIVSSRIEHHAVRNASAFLGRHGFIVTYLPIDRHGRVTPSAWRRFSWRTRSLSIS